MSCKGQFASYHARDIAFVLNNANCTAPRKFISGYFQKPISLAFIKCFSETDKTRNWVGYFLYLMELLDKYQIK